MSGKLGNGIFEGIKDSDGRTRFVEGEGTVVTTDTNVDITYTKWSLSGSHLMFVVAGTIAAGGTVSSGDFVDFAGIPEWVLDKIYNVWGGYYLEAKSFNAMDEDWHETALGTWIGKISYSNLIRIGIVSSETTLKTSGFRMQFDLLIDND